MIAAREKGFSYGFYAESYQQRRSDRRRSIVNADKLKLTSLVIVVFSVGIFIISYFVQVSTLGYRVDQFNRELAVLRVENQALEEQFQQMLALDNVESIAVGELDMVKPVVSEYLLLKTAPVGAQAPADSGDQALDGTPGALPAEVPNPVGLNLYQRLLIFLQNRLGDR